MNVCRMCGADGTGWSMTDWIAHRLADFDAHYPWQGRRFVAPAHGVDRTIPCERMHRGPQCPGVSA